MKKLLVYMPAGGIEYINFLKKRFNVEIVTNIKKTLPNLVVFSGGADVSPSLYGEEKGQFTVTNKERDDKESELFTFCLNNGIYMLGICRGSQFLCVSSGGKLIQHVTGHAIGGTHTITDNREGHIGFQSEITSTHHQMMYPFNLSNRYYSIIAHSTTFLSNVYLNGNNENLSVDKNFLEPEIVFFKSSGALGIQGHPEFTHCPKETVQYCLDIIETTFRFKSFKIKKDEK